MSFARSCWNAFSGAASYTCTKITSAGSSISDSISACFQRCKKNPEKELWNGTKYILCGTTIVAVPICFAGRTYFSAESFLNYASSDMTVESDDPDNRRNTIGISALLATASLIFTMTTRTKPIYEWFFSEASHTNEQHPPALNGLRWSAGWTVRILCNGLSILQMLSTNMTTYLGLQRILALLVSESAAKGIGIAALAFFDVNYIAFNLYYAFQNSKDFQYAINTGHYNYQGKPLFIMMVCFAPAIFSVPTGGYFSAKHAIPLIPVLDTLGEDGVKNLSYITAAVNLLSAGPMTLPSIYNVAKDGIQFHVPQDDTAWIRKVSCNQAHNKWRVLRNGVMLPFGMMDNLGSGALSASGFAYTAAEIPWIQWDIHSRNTHAVIVFVGMSSVISTFAFVTVQSYSSIIKKHENNSRPTPNTEALLAIAPPPALLDTALAQPQPPLEGVVLEQPRDRRAATPIADEKQSLMAGTAASDAPTGYGAVVVRLSTHRYGTWSGRNKTPPPSPPAAGPAAKQITPPTPR